MNYGVIFNSIICLLIFSASLVAVNKILSSKLRNSFDTIFAIFWLLFGMVWLLFGINNIFSFLEAHLETIISYYAYEAVLFAFFLPLAYYIAKKMTNNIKLLTALMACYAITVIYAIFLLFGWEATEVKYGFFETTYFLNTDIVYIFSILFVPLFILNIIYLIKTIRTKKLPPLARMHELLVTISLFLIAINGFLDQVDLVTGWAALFGRLLIIIAPLLAFFAYTDYNYNNKGRIII